MRTSILRSHLVGLFAFASLSTAGVVARADTSVTTPARAGQQALAVRVSGDRVVAAACAAEAGCSADAGAPLALPGSGSLAKAQLESVTLANGRHAVVLETPKSPDGLGYAAVLVAPKAGKGSAPVVLFADAVGGDPARAPKGKVFVVRKQPFEKRAADKGQKGARVFVAEHRQDASICGRPALFGAREVDPETLELAKSTGLQSLPYRERSSSTRLALAPAPVDAARKPPRVPALRATLASSAEGRAFATLTDGDLSTTWSEARAGDGRGEFVAIDAPRDVAIRAIEFTFAPASATKSPSSDGEPAPEAKSLAFPRRVYLATDTSLYELDVPEGAARAAGQRFEAKLAEPVRTSCLAVVLEDAHDGGKPDARVSIAEITARTDLDDLGEQELVALLAKGGEPAKAAAGLLARGGSSALQAVIAGFETLPEKSRLLALDIVEAGPCGAQASFFVKLALAEKPSSPLRARALDRIRRCGRASSPALTALVATGDPAAKALAAAELATVAPADAVRVLTGALTGASDDTRRALRAALARAARSDRARSALESVLAPDAFAKLGPVARLDLVRAVGAKLAEIEGGRAAFAGLASAVPAGPAGMRERYLLQAPAAELARGGDGRALAFVRDAAERDRDPHVRARAVEAASRVPALAPSVARATSDPDPRVRQAALVAVLEGRRQGGPVTPGVGARAASRLASTTEPWTFVRLAAAQALEALPADRAADAELARALEDPSVDIRLAALGALGAHKAKQHASAIRDRAESASEPPVVRARAMIALARLCETGDVGDWTVLAQRAARPPSPEDREIGLGAIAALGLVHPPDLASRLAPLVRGPAPLEVKEAARAALAEAPVCR